MKRLFIIYLYLTWIVPSLSVEAQVKIKYNTQEPQQQEMVKYDSTDISLIRPEKYINQKVIYYQKTSPLYTKDYRSFGGKKDYEAPLFTYFTVTQINRQEVELKRCDNNDICYYTHFGDGVKPIMAVGYYEKYVRAFKNSLWCIDGYDGVFEIVDIWLQEGGIVQLLQSDTTKIELKTMYKQKMYKPYLEVLNKFKGKKWVVNSDLTVAAVDTITVKKGKPYLMFKSECGDDSYDSYDFCIDYLQEDLTNNLDILGLPKYTQEEQNMYIKQYGKINWVNILGSTVTIGMNEDMVLLALGKPDSITSQTDATGNYSIWHYSNKRILFYNGKVDSITSY